MQLQKQARRAARHDTYTRTVQLKHFNPVMKRNIELISINTVHNLSGVTHVSYTARRKQ